MPSWCLVRVQQRRQQVRQPSSVYMCAFLKFHYRNLALFGRFHRDLEFAVVNYKQNKQCKDSTTGFI